MGRSKNDLIEAMNMITAELELPLKVIGLDFKVPESCELLPMDWVRDGYKWLQSIYDNQVLKWKRIRKSVSEEQWARYENWGDMDDFQEAISMKERNVDLRRALVSRLRPTMFMKTKVDKELKRIKHGNKRQHKKTANKV